MMRRANKQKKGSDESRQKHHPEKFVNGAIERNISKPVKKGNKFFSPQAVCRLRIWLVLTASHTLI